MCELDADPRPEDHEQEHLEYAPETGLISMNKYYVTTPIYYVNDEPHVGHVYTTTLADVVARYHRLKGDDTFFLTGTDEHAAKVVEAAQSRDMTPQAWADHNAAIFRHCFQEFGLSPNDFIRTSEARHKGKVLEYVQELLDSGDVYLGQYEGWYDAGQEEYVPENRARELAFKSPINKQPLVRKQEENYFFRLSAYQDALIELIANDRMKIGPAGRKQEVLARIQEGLKDVPISRTGGGNWGIAIPGRKEHAIYVWIDALFNYLSTVDSDERRHYFPADVHLIGKDILWFHAVIWPAMLLALNRYRDNAWITTPARIHAHSFWIREGEKMSKSMGNFVDLAELRDYVASFGIDALRYYLVTHGPLNAADADFARSRFIEAYNADLANTVGNSFSRISNMLARYFNGAVSSPKHEFAELRETAAACGQRGIAAADDLQLDQMATAALDLVRAVDGFIQETEPFRLMKQEGQADRVASILYHAAEAVRIASLLLWPVLPNKMSDLWQRLGLEYDEVMASCGTGQLDSWLRWGQLSAGTVVQRGDPLFPRFTEPTE